jgi:hypothetical protein
MAACHTPLEIINLYWNEVWNKGEAELIREICADPIARHDPGKITLLSHDEQIERVRSGIAKGEPTFSHVVLHADDQFVTSVWDVISAKGKVRRMCGIEVFRAENGRFTDCWNSTYVPGAWDRVVEE